MMAETAYENPLIPNARLRQIYLAMLRARMLSRALPSRKRGGFAPGLEACLVSTSIDLTANDFVSDTLTGGVIDFLRGAGLRSIIIGKKGGPTADCGTAKSLPPIDGIAERLWAAVGAATTLKLTKPEVGAEAETPNSLGVIVVYVSPTEVPAFVWRSALAFAAEQVLPMFFVILPNPAANPSKPSNISALARSAGVPVISVDGDDAVAIYRVAQESIGRARAGGGAAIMECVPFVIQGSKRRTTDAIAGMERYLLRRAVAKQSWLDREAQSFAKRLAAS